MLTPRAKSPLQETQRWFEPPILHHAEQRAQHTTNWAIPAPSVDRLPGHAGVRRYEWECRLVSTPDIKTGLLLGKAVLRVLRNFLNKDRTPQHWPLESWEWAVFYHTNSGGTVSGETKGRLLRDRGSRYGSFLKLRCQLKQKLETGNCGSSNSNWS